MRQLSARFERAFLQVRHESFQEQDDQFFAGAGDFRNSAGELTGAASRDIARSVRLDNVWMRNRCRTASGSDDKTAG